METEKVLIGFRKWAQEMGIHEVSATLLHLFSFFQGPVAGDSVEKHIFPVLQTISQRELGMDLYRT